MASLRIEFRRSAERDLRRIDSKLMTGIVTRIGDLVDNPRPRQALKLSGQRDLYRLRVGDYRVLYEIDSGAGVIIVSNLLHRREAYRDL